MNSPQQNQPKPETKTGASRTKKTSYKPPNKTAFWIVVMMWPPVALMALYVLSLVVNFLAAPQTTSLPESLGSAETLPAATPTWADTANALILVGVILALVGGVVNFAIGLFLVKTKGSRIISFFDISLKNR